MALQLLVYPPLDLVNGSHWARQYVQGRSAEDPDASPLRATDVSALASALILSCEDELRLQADAYTERLKSAGVDVRHVAYPGLIHDAYRMPGALAGARRMLEDSAAALAAAFAAVDQIRLAGAVSLLRLVRSVR